MASYPYRPVMGNMHRGNRRVIVSFDDDTFEDVRSRAEGQNCSFSAQALMLIEIGLETIKADEADDGR